MTLLFGLSNFAGSVEITSTEPIVTLSLNFEAAPVFSSLPSGEVDAAPDVPGEMLAPANEAAFNDLFVGKRAATNFPIAYADFVSPGRFRETQGADTYTGSYTYQNTGSNTGTVTFNYDDGDRCTTSLTFTSAMAGTATFTCADGESGAYTWQLVEIPASGGDSFGVGDTLPGVPTAGQLFPVSGWATEWSGVIFSGTADRSTTYLTFDDGGYIQLQTGTRYTCQAAGGCRVGNGVIIRGTMVGSGGTTAPQPGNQGVSIPQSPSVTTRFSPSQLIVGQRAQFILDWDGVAGATSYKVRVSQFVPIFFTRNPNGSCTVPSSVTTDETSYTYGFTASFQNQLYYTVQACNSAGCSCPPG